jgi:hypothetical protein
MKQEFFFIFLVFFQLSGSFFYSVGIWPEKNALFYIRQDSTNELSLYSYDYVSKENIKLLSKFFTPVSFRLLPDYQGFSFLQHDSLYIKYFSKRSPKRIEFYEPIYGINTIEWLDNKTFYFAARQHGLYKIYQANLEGDVECLLFYEDLDLLYPQIKDNDLFYIARDKKNTYGIELYHLEDHQKECIKLYGKKALTCLSMHSNTEGFFIAYSSLLSRNATIIKFDYCQLKKITTIWETKKLFSFHVPAVFFNSQSSKLIYESLIPFLPQHNHEMIYFVDYTTEENFDLQGYALKLNTIISQKNIQKNYMVPGVFSKDEFFKILTK